MPPILFGVKTPAGLRPILGYARARDDLDGTSGRANGDIFEIRRRMMRAFREVATVLTLALISAGVFFVYDALTRAQAARPQTMVAGASLCGSALLLLYSLGRRAEK